MKMKLFILLVISSTIGFSQKNYDTIYQNNIDARSILNRHYTDSNKSPLKPEERAKFKPFPYFPVDTNYYVYAKFSIDTLSEPFEMQTSTSRKPKYRAYGTATFELFDTTYSLTLYQNLRLIKIEKYKDYLFLPFSDFTNGNESYGGGRYIDLRIPKDSIIIIDFNRSYNPYCAYTAGYSCPIPPKENSLSTYIKAGIRYYQEKE